MNEKNKRFNPSCTEFESKREFFIVRTKAVNAFSRPKPVLFPPKTRYLTGTKSPVHSILSCLFFGKPVGFQKGVCNYRKERDMNRFGSYPTFSSAVFIEPCFKLFPWNIDSSAYFGVSEVVDNKFPDFLLRHRKKLSFNVVNAHVCPFQLCHTINPFILCY